MGSGEGQRIFSAHPGSVTVASACGRRAGGRGLLRCQDQCLFNCPSSSPLYWPRSPRCSVAALGPHGCTHKRSPSASDLISSNRRVRRTARQFVRPAVQRDVGMCSRGSVAKEQAMTKRSWRTGWRRLPACVPAWSAEMFKCRHHPALLHGGAQVGTSS